VRHHSHPQRALGQFDSAAFGVLTIVVSLPVLLHGHGEGASRLAGFACPIAAPGLPAAAYNAHLAMPPQAGTAPGQAVIS
jgi:hypothetical protein